MERCAAFVVPTMLQHSAAAAGAAATFSSLLIGASPGRPIYSVTENASELWYSSLTAGPSVGLLVVEVGSEALSRYTAPPPPPSHSFTNWQVTENSI